VCIQTHARAPLKTVVQYIIGTILLYIILYVSTIKARTIHEREYKTYWPTHAVFSPNFLDRACSILLNNYIFFTRSINIISYHIIILYYIRIGMSLLFRIYCNVRLLPIRLSVCYTSIYHQIYYNTWTVIFNTAVVAYTSTIGSVIGTCTQYTEK